MEGYRLIDHKDTDMDMAEWTQYVAGWMPRSPDDLPMPPPQNNGWELFFALIDFVPLCFKNPIDKSQDLGYNPNSLDCSLNSGDCVMDAAFEKALTRTLSFEGGYSDDPDDPGGRTNYGITEGVWHDWCRGNIPYSISRITIDDAKRIYYEMYWKRAQLPRLDPQTCGPILPDVFDACVNNGVEAASILLQEAYNALIPRSLAPLTVDGVIGPVTAAAINSWCKRLVYAEALLAAYRLQRGKLWNEIMTNKPSQRKYIYGWYRRLL